MQARGYIYLERKMLDKGFWKNSYYAHLWVHLLFKASHRETEFLWDGKMQKLKRGQFVTGRKALSEETSIPETTIERILDFFENEGQIGQQKTNKFRLITLNNYTSYQDKRTTEKSKKNVRGHEHGQQEDDEINETLAENTNSKFCLRTTNGQQTDNKRTHSSNVSNVINTLSKDKGATPRPPKGTVLLNGEPPTMNERIDHSFPRSRLYGDEKLNWLLDYAEHLLGRKLAGQERWNRIYAKHMATKYGMRRGRELLEFALAPDSWWFDKVSQFSTLYKNFELIEKQIVAKNAEKMVLKDKSKELEQAEADRKAKEEAFYLKNGYYPPR